MLFALVIFDYDGVLIDSLSHAISAGEEFCRSVAHDRVPTEEIIGSLEIMTYSEIARSIGLTPEQAERFSSHVFECFQNIVKENPDFIVNSVQGLVTLLNLE